LPHFIYNLTTFQVAPNSSAFLLQFHRFFSVKEVLLHPKVNAFLARADNALTTSALLIRGLAKGYRSFLLCSK
jgi:hypothetical protein